MIFCVIKMVVRTSVTDSSAFKEEYARTRASDSKHLTDVIINVCKFHLLVVVFPVLFKSY